jgi:hypothetical protein
MMTRYDDERVVTLLRDIDLPGPPADRLGAVTRRARAAESRRLSLLAGAMSVVLIGGLAGAVSLRSRPAEQVLTVADSARTTQDAGSARLSLRITVVRSAQALVPVGDLMTLSGPVDFRHNRYALTGAFQKTKAEVRGIGKDQWVHISLAAALPGFPVGGSLSTKPWIHSVTSSTSPASVLQTMDPSSLLDALTTKGTTVSRRTNGDRTSTVVRIPSGALGGLDATGGRRVDVTVQSDSAGRIRLLSYDAGLPGVGTMRTSVRYDDFGIDVQVTPPPADQVQEAPTASGGGITTKHFSGTTGSSPADRKKACTAIRAAMKQQPAPTTEQQKQAYAQFQQLAKRICG